MISTGAKVLGPFKVGDNSRIAANAVVLQEIPEDSTVVGIPGKVVRIQGKRVNPSNELDQVKIPDPVKMEICKLKETIAYLENQLEMIEDKLGIEDQKLVDVLNESSETYVSGQFNERMRQVDFIRQPERCSCKDTDCITKEACKQYGSLGEKNDET